MADYKAAHLNYMDEKGIRYENLKGQAVSVTYNGDSLKNIQIIVEFAENGDHLATFHCWSIGSFKDDDKYLKGLMVCNEMNTHYRWVKFYLDGERDVVAAADAILDINSAGAECAEIVSRMVGIIDEAYPNFMKALWA